MRPTQHITCNAVLQAPPGVSHEECVPVPITRVHYTPQDQYTVSTFWQPSPEEVALLVSGGVVKVEVWGITMPPLHVSAKAMDDRTIP